ncbi:uncharacterized protein VTP21DRAFT_8820 [Calcarisporiella thermophila]|uniref:uncharacterized protein n=1 Tax=Calcarisporiella thermophila TaxID=911321 RepID=UPI0037421F40
MEVCATFFDISFLWRALGKSSIRDCVHRWCRMMESDQIPVMPAQPFWRKHVGTLPGSVKLVPSKSGATAPSMSGAAYSYTPIPLTIRTMRSLSTSTATSISPPIKDFSEFMADAHEGEAWNSEEDERQLREARRIAGMMRESEETEGEMEREAPSSKGEAAQSKQAEERAEGDEADLEEKRGEAAPEVPSHQTLSGSLRDSRAFLRLPPRPDEELDEAEQVRLSASGTRLRKFQDLLQAPNVDLTALRKLSWNGVPEKMRPMVWQLLLGYLPCNSDRRAATLARKRKEYEDSVAQAFARGQSGLDQTIWHQIRIDVPRTNPGIPLYQCPTTQQSLERILYVWAIRHPASGYVQGINDLVTPFFQVFLSSYIDGNPETCDSSKLPREVLSVVEADSFWCLTKLLGGIQDNYTFAQPGIQRQIVMLRDLIYRIDVPLASHLDAEGVEFLQFAFRWMNCLLMREFQLRHTIRMWDAYLSEGPDGFSVFHLYVCAAFLVKWSEQLRSMDFQEIMMFLQALPTQHWTDKEVELLLSEAFMWKSLFHNAPNHLTRG